MIRLAKAACPNGHVVMQYCYPDEDTQPALAILKQTLGEYIQKRQIPPYCQVCKSSEIRYSDNPTRFINAREAEIVLGGELLRSFDLDRMLWPTRN